MWRFHRGGHAFLAPHRRLGYATEAIVALMDAATTDDGVHRFRLAIGPGNVASLAVATRLGFIEVGHQVDDANGLEVLFERTWP